MTRINKSLFGSSDHSDAPCCPLCSAPLHIKNSKSGPFYGCSTYPTCSFSKPLHDKSVSIVKTIDGAECPQCHANLAVKSGRFGLFIGCLNYPECHYIASDNREEDTYVACPSCKQGELFEKTNRFGKLFYSCSNYPACRYVINSPPVARECAHCGWAILIKKAGKLICPQRDCEYETDDEQP